MQIENAMYPVNVEALNTVFSPYGFVQKIAIFEKNGQTQVRMAVVTYRGAGANIVCQNLHRPFWQQLATVCHVWLS